MWCGAATSSIFCCTDAASQVSAVVESPKKFSKSQCRERFGTTAQIYVGIPKHTLERICQVYAKVVVKDRIGLLSRY